MSSTGDVLRSTTPGTDETPCLRILLRSASVSSTSNPSGSLSLPSMKDPTMRHTVHAHRPSSSPTSASVMSPEATISTSLALRAGISDLGSLTGDASLS